MNRQEIVSPETVRQLEDFPSKVLARFIRAEIPILSQRRADEIFAKLRSIEAQIRLDGIKIELEALHNQSPRLHGPDNLKEWRRMMARIDELHQEWDRLMNIAYPLAKWETKPSSFD